MSAPARPEYRHRDDLDPTQPISLPLVGYTDRIHGAPGDTIRFMVSSDHARYRSRLVRLIHGDTNPGGPGFKQVVVPSAIDAERDGAHHDLRGGS
jgi:N,N-dimethylformamidase